MDLQLSGKRALVTGANFGIGEGIADVLAQEGATVIVHGRHEGRVKAGVERITKSGGRAFAACGDIATDDGVKAVVDAALSQIDGIDILVANAGGNEATATDWFGFTLDDWIEVAQKNTFSCVRLIHALVPAMQERGWGRVINISSTGAVQTEPSVAHYCASKAALNNLTLSLSKALKGSGVTANAVSPGSVRTPRFDAWLEQIREVRGWPGTTYEELEASYVKDFPIQTTRIGRPEDIGNAVAFLASPLADYITGINLRIDGGAVMSMN